MPDAKPLDAAPSTDFPAASAEPKASPSGERLLFEFNDERRFQLYIERRKSYSDGARNAYQRFDQTIVGLSAGSIVLSISFLKDVGHSPESIPWLFASWAFFLLASLAAFISILTSAASDREQIVQLDCLATTSKCDETRARRLGKVTGYLNDVALGLCSFGVVSMIVFVTANVLQL